MNPPARLFLVVLLALGAAVAAPARLGETLPDLRKRFGTPVPQGQPRKDQAFWLFEGDDGQLMYSVTFNASGRSIAEGLKPLKRARFNKQVAMDFIDSELATERESKTRRVVPPGQAYQFAGKAYACGEKEYVVVDEALDTLVIWNQAGVPSVLILSGEMMSQM